MRSTFQCFFLLLFVFSFALILLIFIFFCLVFFSINNLFYFLFFFISSLEIRNILAENGNKNLSMSHSCFINCWKWKKKQKLPKFSFYQIFSIGRPFITPTSKVNHFDLQRFQTLFNTFIKFHINFTIFHRIMFFLSSLL